VSGADAGAAEDLYFVLSYLDYFVFTCLRGCITHWD
jgi:hypothetical protein